ncbi:hypothetical protein [Chryseobacterium sp. SL1]|uniref:hypothetical protein n=1 Tax=Chryseobacterium sp. SL1 TaxID=2995159 RepID=UPI00227241C3|nr:hypothetical protein [Chryseobacterium sp. SL1]MCY1662571.1 hypothetical protein [Chryseobacterium sp. SL1]
MNYATTHHSGNGNSTRRKKTTPIEPTTARLYPVDETDEGCAGNQKGQKEIRPRNHAPNGFLKTTFLPRLKEGHSVQACLGNEHMERDFYISLSILSEHYGIIPIEVRQFSYPYNMALSLWNAKTQLRNSIASFDTLQLDKDKGRYFLKTEERCKTGTTLFYIPVLPLFIMLQNKQKSKTAQLLVSVCAYLYHIADVPYYRQEDSYLYWQYEMMTDWVAQDEECEYRRSNIAEIQKAEWVGDRMEQKIFNRKTLTAFGKRLQNFRANDPFDEQCHQVSRRFFDLYTDYPNENIFRNTKMMNEDEDKEDEDEIIPMDNYISFWADSEGWLSESLTECINNEFNEYTDVDEPKVVKVFDGNPLPIKDLNFESRLFELLHELIYLLNTYKQQRNGNYK